MRRVVIAVISMFLVGMLCLPMTGCKKNKTLSYDLNGGVGIVPTSQTSKSNNFEVASNENFSKPGFSFVCWNTSKSQDGTDVTGSFSCEEDTVLYAKWQKKTSDNAQENAYQDILAKLSQLEYFASIFSQSHSNVSAKLLVANYIRSDRYKSVTWNLIAGPINNDFEKYVNENKGDLDINTLKSVESVIPTETTSTGTSAVSTEIDFVHMFATISIKLNTNNNQAKTELGGWAGDLAQLVQEIKDEEGTKTELEAIAISKLGVTSSFGMPDMNADLDAINITNSYSSSFAFTLENYYALKQNRIKTFLDSEFSQTQSTESALYGDIKERFVSNEFVDIWLRTNANISYLSHVNHVEACCTALAKMWYVNK